MLRQCPPALSIDDVTHNEGNSGSTNYTFTISLSTGSAQTITVDYQTQNGTATTADGDYQSNTGTLTFNPGETSKQLTVLVNGDTTVEPDEAFTVHLSNPVGATIADAEGIGTIVNDDTDVSVAVSPASVAEDGAPNLTYTFTRTGLVTGPLTANFNVSGTATFGTDYTQSGAATFGGTGTVAFGAGESTRQVTIDPTPDTTDEPNETVILTVTSGTGYTVGSPSAATGTITDDDAMPTINIGDVTLPEGNSGPTNFLFLVTLTNPSSTDISVDYFTQNNTAAQPSDYTSTSGTVTFLAGETNKTITIPINGDTTYETNETFFVNLNNNSSNSTLGDSQGLGTITNDDAAPSFSIDDVTQSEGNSGTTAYVFTVTKTGSTELSSAVAFATADNTATVGDGDYSPTANTLSFGPSDTTKTITVSVNGDTHVEPDESFFVNLSSPTNATISDSQGVGTITNDDTSDTYTWVGPVGNTLWANPLNWTPTRLVPAVGDTLIFNGSVTSSPTATGIPTQTIKGLHFQNGVNATFNAEALLPPGTKTLTISGASGDLLVQGGGTPSTLTLATSTALNLVVTSSATGSIGGQIIVQDGAHRLIGTAASAITFQSGGRFTTASGLTGNAFGDGSSSANGAPGSVIFASGSAYFHNAGSSPFGAAGNTVVTFQTGSEADYLTNTGFDSNGRTYANLVIGNASTAVSACDCCDIASSCTDNFQFDNLVINSTGTTNSSLSHSGSGSNTITIQGNITSNGVGNVPGGTAPDVFLTSGSGGIVINSGSTTTFGNDVNSARGIFFGSNATVNNGTTLTLARILQMGGSAEKTLVVDVTGGLNGGTNGYVVGKVQKNFNTGSGQSFTFHIGDVIHYAPAELANLNVTGGGNITGYTTGNDNVVTGNPGSGINPSKDVNRSWNLTRGGGLTLSLFDAAFTYANGDIDGGSTESSFILRKLTSGTWSSPPGGSSVNTGTHTVTGTGFADLSDFAVGEPATTSTNVTSSLNPSTYGDSVTFTATVTSGGSPVTEGNVEFRSGGSDCSSGTVVQAGAAVDGSGQKTYTTSTLTAGSHTIRVCYLGAAAFNTSDGTVMQTVDKATVTVTPDSGQSKVYGTSDPTLTYTHSALSNGDTDSVFSGALSRVSGENVGNYAITLGSLSAGSNYDTVLSATPVNFAITQAASTTTIDCSPGSFTYTGSPITPCTATVTRVGDANTTTTVVYANNTNVGTATADASYAGDANHTGSTATQATFAITQASSTTTIDCSPGSFTYTGSAITPCTATVTRVGDANTTATVVYANNTNVGTATADASYAGDANHTGSTATQVTFAITAANTTTMIANAASLSSTPTVVGQSYTVNWSVSVNSPGAGTPTGTVTVSGGSGCLAPVTAGSCSVTSTSSGAKTLIATYTSDTPNFNGSTSAGASHTVNAASTTTIADDKAVPYSDLDQSITLTATVSATYTQVNGGAVMFTVTDASSATVGSPVTSGNVVAGAASASYTLPGGTDAGTYTITAAYTGTPDFTVSSDTATLTVNPGELLSDVANLDADFKHIDGFDVLFSKGSTSTTLELKNTNPATFRYRLLITNTTGAPLNSNNGVTARAFIEVPAMANCGGVPCASTVSTTLPAFSLRNKKAVRVHPDDKTDDMSVVYSYKSTGSCNDPTGYSTTFPSDESPRCIMVSGFALPKKHRAEIDITFEFRWKKTLNWNGSSNLWFYSGFPFKATVQATFTSPVVTKTGYFTAGLMGAGQRVTAIGGFSFNQFAMPTTGVTIRLFNSAADVLTCGTSAANRPVASDTVSSDGFYFIWRKGNDQGPGANDLPDGIKYVVQVCNGSTQISPLRTLTNKLGKKEFDEEDFYGLIWP